MLVSRQYGSTTEVGVIVDELLQELKRSPMMSPDELHSLLGKVTAARRQAPTEDEKQFAFVIEFILVLLRNNAACKQYEEYPQLMTQKQVSRFVGYSVSTIKTMVAQGQFPKPVATGLRSPSEAKRTPRWRKTDVERYIASRQTARC